MTSYLFIWNMWPEFAKLFYTRPITIHEFYSTGMDCLIKTFFGVYFKFIMLGHKSTSINTARAGFKYIKIISFNYKLTMLFRI